MPENYDVIVTGGGIAGLTAAATAARLGLNTLILTGQVFGGHLVSIEKIDGFPGHPEGIPGFDLCPATEELAAEAGVSFVAEEATALTKTGDGWQVSCDNDDYIAPAVIFATGTSLKSLGVKGESEFFGKGVSHCASCDAPLLRGKPVAVIGGGDFALQEALTLVPAASKITIITNGQALSAQAAYRAQIEGADNVDVRTGTKVLEILGETGVTGLRISGAGGEETLTVDSAFVFIGLKPNSSLISDDLKDSEGYIVTDAAMRTSRQGLYAAGTLRTGSAFRAASSAGDGTVAALSVYKDFPK